MLVDTSVWVDHFRRGTPALAARLGEAEVLCHPFVIGELATGNLRRRTVILTLLAALPQAPMARHDEVMEFLTDHRLMAKGLGWIDVHLLASTRLAGTALWTLDRRLQSHARRLGVSVEP